MSVKIKSILDPGNPEKERFVLSVHGDTDIGSYLVLITEISKEGGPVSGSHLSFWFPDKKIKGGDLVVLYTKKGNEKSIKNSDGSSSHFYYWELAAAQLGKPKVGVVLITGPRWDFDVPKIDSAS